MWQWIRTRPPPVRTPPLCGAREGDPGDQRGSRRHQLRAEAARHHWALRKKHRDHPSQLALYRRAEQAARDGADALNVGDALGVQRATQELTDALTGGSSDDPLVGIERGCRTAKTKPLPRVPRGGGINA